MSKTSEKKRQSPAPPIFIVSLVLRFRRFLLRIADMIVPSYLAIYDRFMGSAMTSLIHSAAELQIADILLEGPLNAAELSKRTNTSPDILERTMRALVSINVFRRLSNGKFANNKVSLGLVKNSLGGIRGFARFFGKEPIIRAWNNLPNTLHDGLTAFNCVNGQSVWEWMAKEPEVQAAFAEGMSSMTEIEISSIIAAYPFDKSEKVCDVGGGVGMILAAVLKHHPHLKGVLYDSESMLGEAKEYMSDWGVSDRVELVTGSFFDSVPHGADTYIIKTVLHNWNDENALKILLNCRAAMKTGHRLLVSDFIYNADSISTLVPFMDLAGMMIYSGRERTREDMSRLFNAAGFQLNRVIPLPACQVIFEGVAVEFSNKIADQEDEDTAIA